MHAEPNTARAVFDASQGTATTRYYRRLEALGPAGKVASNLFRAVKASYRAKRYKGGPKKQAGNGKRRSFRDLAYDRKAEALAALAVTLDRYGEQLGMAWGWGRDRSQRKHSWVLYVELPTGQLGLHTDKRGKGPEYAGKWDRCHANVDRLVAYCDSLFATLPVLQVIDTCDNCGACCLDVGHPPFVFNSRFPDEPPHFDPDLPPALMAELRADLAAVGGDNYGNPCIWFDLETRRCRHYEHRPVICQTYERGADDCREARKVKGIDGAT